MNEITANTVDDRNTQMSTQITETVKLSTYKIKKRLEAERVLAVEGHKNTNAAISEDLEPLLRDIDTRVCSVVKEEALLKALTIFNTLSDYVDVGSENTYFDDNRNDDICHSAIAESLVSDVSCRIRSDKRVLQTEEVRVTYTLNFWGSICGHINNLGDESEVIFEPKTLVVLVKLDDWEIGTLSNLKAREAEAMQYNLEINDIDKKLKNMSSITEDIEFAMISAKANAEGNQQTVDVADRIAEAILDGVEPSTLLLGNQ
jgi:hypothetical protein